MAGFGTGLVHALAVGTEGAGIGEEEHQQKLLARAAAQRAQANQSEELNLKRIHALAAAAEAGLTVAPTGGERSGDSGPGGSDQPSAEAGPAASANPTRLGTVAGNDITVPAHLESKAVRSAREMKAAGLGPKQTLHERVMELRQQGTPMADAITQARGEFGEAPLTDPTIQHQKNRLFDVKHPTRGSGDGATPESRAKYVLRRASDLQKARKVGYRVQPGMARPDAEQTAGEEWDRVHGIDTGVTPPSAKPGPGKAVDPGGDIVLPGSASPTAGGDNTLKTPTAQQQARSTVDPQYKAYLKANKYKVQ